MRIESSPFNTNKGFQCRSRCKRKEQYCRNSCYIDKRSALTANISHTSMTYIDQQVFAV